jgi:hypothetical protein
MTSTPRRLTPDDARALSLDTEPWLSCEDCFDLADRYAEALVEHPQTRQLPEMLVHLRGCAACAEETESLVRLVASDLGVDPAAALARLQE